MVTFSGNITVGQAIFLGSAKNAGTITSPSTLFKGESKNIANGVINGPANFIENSMNDDGGAINGEASFGVCARNWGDVSGNVAQETGGRRNCRWFKRSRPPLKASWVTSGSKRRLVIIGSRNTEVLMKMFGNSSSFYAGPWQPCPSAGCFADPASYIPLAITDFVMDYEEYPNYMDYPGNGDNTGAML